MEYCKICYELVEKKADKCINPLFSIPTIEPTNVHVRSFSEHNKIVHLNRKEILFILGTILHNTWIIMHNQKFIGILNMYNRLRRVESLKPSKACSQTHDGW